MQQRLSVVTLGVQDLERSLKFYRDGLGWQTKSAAKDGIIFFQLNGFVLGLYPLEKLAEDAEVPAAGSGFGGITLAQNLESPAAVDKLLSEIPQAGGKVAKPAKPAFWGGYSGYFADPDGYLWEVAHNPFWKIDGEGRTLL